MSVASDKPQVDNPAEDRLKVSFFVHNLSGNPIARVMPLASSISRKYDVEVLGFLMGGRKVYKPYRDRFDYKTISTSARTFELFRNIPRLASMATGDIVYACKPLMSSFAPALVSARLRDHKPLFLDVEDDDWGRMASESLLDFVYINLLRGWRLGTSWKYTAMLNALRGWSDGVTVGSREIQRHYGGTLLRYGIDEQVFDPSRFDGALASLRRKWKLPESRKLALFAGVPRSHKGLDTLCEALRRPAADRWDIVLAGPKNHPISQKMAVALGARCHRLGYLPHAKMPELLRVADAVPLPQKVVPYAESQVPVKMIEALAMARPIVSTRVGDLPEILGDGRRGWVVEPECPEALTAALADIADRPKEAHCRSQAGRQWFMENASSAAVFSTLDAMFTKVLSGNERTA